MSRAPQAPTPAAMQDGVFHAAFLRSPAMQSVVRATDGLIVEVNDTFLEKFGFARDAVIGRSPVDLNFWAEPEKQLAWKQRLEAGDSVTDYEVRLRAVDGRIFTVLLNTHAVVISGVRHYVTAGVDVTARREMEARLRERDRQLDESELRFRAAFHSSPVMQSIVRFSDNTIVEINATLTKVLGYSREDVVGRTPDELSFWAQPAALPALRAQLATHGRVRSHEIQVRAKDGSVRTVLLSAELVEIAGVTHSMNASVDITERKAMEARLRDTEAHTRALYESLTAAVVVHDESGFLQANPAAIRMFGATSAGQLVGLDPTHTSARTQPDGEPSAAAARRHIGQALAKGTERFEWLARRLDGTEFPVDITLTALPLGGRTVVQAVMHDLTERKRAEAELQNALAKERELRQLKSEFVSLVSHEFRTPLEVIMSSADNLSRYHDRLAPEKRADLLRNINKSVRRMAGMMEEVLVLGRLESERMTFSPRPIDLAAFCRRVCDELASATGTRCPIRLQTELAGAAHGDESLLRHIFANLISNAVKYSPEGAPVEFSVARERALAVCRIADRGCGIPDADRARLFEAFHRGANVRHIPGTGLGLLIVRRCVELHGGEIEFESVEGHGTTFTVRLPLFVPAAPIGAAS